MLLPYSEGGLLSFLNEAGKIKSTEYLPEGVKVSALLTRTEIDKYEEMIEMD